MLLVFMNGKKKLWTDCVTEDVARKKMTGEMMMLKWCVMEKYGIEDMLR